MWDFLDSFQLWSLHCVICLDKEMIAQRICSQLKKLVGWNSLVRSVNGNFPCYLSARPTSFSAKPQEQQWNSIWDDNLVIIAPLPLRVLNVWTCKNQNWCYLIIFNFHYAFLFCITHIVHSASKPSGVMIFHCWFWKLLDFYKKKCVFSVWKIQSSSDCAYMIGKRKWLNLSWKIV